VSGRGCPRRALYCLEQYCRGDDFDLNVKMAQTLSFESIILSFSDSKSFFCQANIFNTITFQQKGFIVVFVSSRFVCCTQRLRAEVQSYFLAA
jgi:hypothetical protein